MLLEYGFGEMQCKKKIERNEKKDCARVSMEYDLSIKQTIALFFQCRKT